MNYDSRDTGLIRRAANLEIQEEQRLDLAEHLAGCGGRPVLEALIAAHRGQPVDTVLRDFRRLPAQCGRPRLPGKVREVAT